MCLCTHSVGVGLYRQSCIDREHFKEEGQLSLEGVFDLGAQAGREVGDPLAQRGLCNPVVFNLCITFWVSAHPQLEETAEISPTSCSLECQNTSQVRETQTKGCRSGFVND